MTASDKQRGFPGVFILALLPSAMVWLLKLGQKWNLYLTIFSLLPIAAAY